MQSYCASCGGPLIRAALIQWWYQYICQDIKVVPTSVLINSSDACPLTDACLSAYKLCHTSCTKLVLRTCISACVTVCWLTASKVGTYTTTQHGLLQSYSWEGYLIASQASTSLGSSTSAQDLLRKRYLGISGSNKLVGALEVQQVASLYCLELQNLLPPLDLSNV